MTLVAVAMVLAGVDTLAVVQRGGMSLKAPTQWVAAEGDDGTITWSAPQGAGAVSFYVGSMDTPVSPAACVTRLVDALGKEGFARVTVAKRAAAKKVMTDFVPGGEVAQKVVTTTVVGCDGKTKWLMTFTTTQAAAVRLGAVLRRMLDTISYAR